MSRRLSALLVILAGVLWGIISIFVSYLAGCGFSGVEICFMRIVTCAAMLFLFLLVYDRSLLKIRLRDIWLFVGTGIVSLTLFSLCYFNTIINVEASVAVSLLYTSPAFIMIFSALLFREKITPLKIVAIIMTVAGCALVSGFSGAGAMPLQSLLVGVGAGLFYALYSIFARYALKKYQPLTINFYTFLFSSLGFLLMVRGQGISHIAGAAPRVLVIAALSGLICGVLPYLFYTTGLEGLDNSTAGVLVAIEPLVGCLVGLIGFKESISALKITGIALVLLSIVIIGLGNKENSYGNKKG